MTGSTCRLHNYLTGKLLRLINNGYFTGVEKRCLICVFSFRAFAVISVEQCCSMLAHIIKNYKAELFKIALIAAVVLIIIKQVLC